MSPFMGMDATKSHFSRMRRLTPSPSLPITRPIGPVTDADPDNNQDDQSDVNEEGLNDEQEQREPDNQDNNESSGDDSESEKQINDLQDVIDDPDASEEDKQAARELLNEIKKGA